MTSVSPPRLYAIVARDAPVAVVFRRGPSKWWHIMKWNLENDVIEHGAWFKHKLYLQDCALSPDGRLLSYAALQLGENISAPWERIFAISKMPWLTALCAWSMGSTYFNGSWFFENDRVAVSGYGSLEMFHGHFPGEVSHELPYESRTDFYQLQGWESPNERIRGKATMQFEKINCSPFKRQLFVVCKRDKHFRHLLILVSRNRFFREDSKSGPDFGYVIETEDGDIEAMSNVAWADWDHNGRLLIATRDGRLQIRDPRKGPEVVTWEYDVSDLKPDPSPSPDWAQHW